MSAVDLSWARSVRPRCPECGSRRLHWDILTASGVRDESIPLDLVAVCMDALDLARQWAGSSGLELFYGSPWWVCADCHEVGIFGDV